jgi:hypothetical protein
VLYRTAFHVCARIERTNRPPRDQAGWLQRDSLAPALLPVLRAMADAVPMVVASIGATDVWAAEDAKAGEPVPDEVEDIGNLVESQEVDWRAGRDSNPLGRSAPTRRSLLARVSPSGSKPAVPNSKKRK